MPSLGFLKKKRTREGNSDPSSSNPTSPVTPTSSTSFIRSASISRPFSSLLPRSSTTSTSSPVAASTAQTHAQAPASAGTAPQPQTQSHPYPSAPAHQTAATEAERQQMNSVNVLAPSYPAGSPNPHDPQNLPSISNLINPPQHDSAANSYSNSNNSRSHSPYPIDSRSVQTASPGTTPALVQQQQQQALPQPTMQPAGQQQPARQPAQQPAYQQHQQQPSNGSQARITKGKYSLGDFDILRTLGTGSFGRVHLVQSKHNQRFYAVKVLKKAQVVKMKQVEHTNDERRMLSDVKHPFLITLWGTFQDLKNLYMVMDFVEGGELFSLLRKSGRFPNPVAKFYAAEVTLALEYLHSKNIIYRDLKPENLLLDRHGHLKITDFGFAKRVPDKTWTLCGTPDYLAPEVVSNKGYNKSVDWWSLGILIYEMLCGYTPFWDSGSPMKIYENILKGKVKYPAYVNADAQNLLERLITADLTKRLGNLYGGPQDVKDHPWFTEVTWDRLARKDIDAPYTPPVKAGAGDASQFDRYPEDPEKYGQTGGNDEYGHLFTEF
ncbi:kinase-like domain-containing protein [Ilyonectria robusta]|uniref:kinase-like domain-containing protein n=1 Tax=Ilyonectria robusta TaxID=1079257 RepID=UPI001E8EA703|nr:kinase-like domain-containing protein [Ilyonectria robusta]KAH8737934.1 kinase-like domain-containing protein [Ilyonectria robusta]